MATADLIKELNDDLNAAYSAVEAKGGTVPAQKNSRNLATAVESISGGSGPSPEPAYDIPYFDGGDYGAIAYLDANGEVAYYTATSVNDAAITASTNSGLTAGCTVKTLDDGYVITRGKVLAYSVGDQNTKINDYFAGECRNFQTIYGMEKITSIGSWFLFDCTQFNQEVILPSNMASIPEGLLYGCSSYNQPLMIPRGVTQIGQNVLSGCHSFNQPIILPEGLTKIGNNFMRACYAFNQPISFPASLTTMGYECLAYCYVFNQSVDISHVTSLDRGFLMSAYNFNQPIILSDQLTKFPAYFVDGWHNFRQPIKIPDSVTEIGDYTFCDLFAFNQPIILPKGLTKIGAQFMRNLTSYSYPLTIPDSVTSIGSYFMNEVHSFTGPLNVGKSFGFTSDNYTLSVSSTSSIAYSEGVKITGENAEGWMAGLSNRTANPYRNLILYTPEPEVPDLSQPLDKAALDKIQKIVREGRASELFSLGDEFLVNYDEYVMPFEVVGFEDVEVEDGSTVPAINLLAKHLNNGDGLSSSSSGYSGHNLQINITGAYAKKLDPDFIACLANTKVETLHKDATTDVVYDKLFAPSASQLHITSSSYVTAEQVKIEGAAFTGYATADNSRRVKTRIDTGGTSYYWTRTIHMPTTDRCVSIMPSGEPTSSTISSRFYMLVACNLIGGDEQ